ncbi:heme NO-binding domain-containing protein [Muricoccus nepalensis]|uniref:heme NO-binding domain-containing protein n=1 Tax=Muricoccus nepalensis TaxID=1854500 RepID=UPI0013876741|nr:heme NO-binding domain-containing protein [Roseomonas nepalensis]
MPYLLSAFLEETAGPAVRGEILAEAGFDPNEAFRIDAGYADRQCRRILDAACARLGLSEEAAFAAFAPFFLDRSRTMFPAFFNRRPRVRDFLLHQPEVHNTLAAGLKEGQRDHVAAKFRVEPMPGGVRVFYRSENRLAGLYAAVACRLGEEFGEPTRVRYEAGGPGDAECIMAVEVLEQPAQAAA